MNNAELFSALLVVYPDLSCETADTGEILWVVPAERLVDVACTLREDEAFAFDSLMCLSGLDLSKYPTAEKGVFVGDLLACVYHLHSFTHGHEAAIKVVVPKNETASIPSVEAVWPVAGWFEREILDLYGIDFPGNHDRTRLMMPKDWVGHPLRKDYEYPQTYGGWDLKRDGQTFTSGPYA
ncbi:MAG: hypothetical protein RL318_784 [Fibrobacterota bacterium]|jgi:NADH-quinone oxidoreductase subunit C